MKLLITILIFYIHVFTVIYSDETTQANNVDLSTTTVANVTDNSYVIPNINSTTIDEDAKKANKTLKHVLEISINQFYIDLSPDFFIELPCEQLVMLDKKRVQDHSLPVYQAFINRIYACLSIFPI